MKSRHFPVIPVFPMLGVVALVLPLGCSGTRGGSGGAGGAGGMAGAPGDDRLFVPEDLPNTPRAGDVGQTLKLVAATLVQGPAGLEFYAAVRNDGNAPSCNAGMLTDFIDKAGQTVASVATTLRSKQLYRLDAGTILSCVDPGQIAMTDSTYLPAAIVIGELARMTHTFPTFGGFDGIVPLVGLTVTQVETVPKAGGSAYTGTLTNALDVTASAPTVAIFPLNRVGRPLGMATVGTTIVLPPGGTWSFETTTVNDPGVAHAAYPAAFISD
jgi:hypothetical protein